MLNGKKVIALIPARGGSKGLPGKNIKSLAGKPLINWTIEVAKKCAFIDRVIVSTDDEQIAEVSRQAGADVPFIRPAQYATDHATGTQVIMHALEWLKSNDQAADILVLLQPTSPLRVMQDLETALLLYIEKNAAIVSVCEVNHHPFWMNTLPTNLSLKDFLRPEIKDANRQDLPIYYQLNGAIYIKSFDEFIKDETFFTENTYAYIMPKERSIDIDSEVDFSLAQIIIEKRGS